MNRFKKRLWAWLHRRQLDRDLEDELRFHLEMKAEATGDWMEARRSVGNPTRLKEVCRELWTFASFETWWQDLRYSLRALAMNRSFTALAVTVLGLGIGADTAVFTIARGALTWNLGLDHVDRIVWVGTTDVSRGEEYGVSYPDFRDFQSQVKSLSGLAAYQLAPVNLSDHSGIPERHYSAQMSANGNWVAEQKSILGRDFAQADERPGAPPVMILAHHVWRDRYGADPLILGKCVRLNDRPATIIGVMPPGKRFPEDTDLWTPLVPDATREKRDNRILMLFGRLADGLKLATARTELGTIARRLASQYPNTNQGLTADVRPIVAITGANAMKPVFMALLGAVSFVLFIACADVANMLLARGARRSREISIRVAIGAGRARIIRQLLVESIVLSVAGGFLGWLIALGGLHWFDAGLGALVKPVWLNLSLNRSAFIYLATISIGTGILFGLAPALRLANIDINSAVRDGGYGAAGGRSGRYLSNLLIVCEMALCVVLLTGAGLMIRSAVRLYGAPIGVDSSSVLTMRINLPESKYPGPEDEVAFHERLKKRLEAHPGVEAAAIVSNLPFSGWTPVAYELEGAASEAGGPPRIGAIVASAGYFRVMRLRMLRGRVFTESDGSAEIPTVIVNEMFAKKFWPGEDALGKRLRLIKETIPQQWLTVVGIVPDVLQNFRDPLEHDPLIYLPYTAEPERVMVLVSRTRVPPATLAGAFRREVQSLDEDLPVYEVRSLDDRIAESRLTVSLLGGMLSIFSGIALVLAAIGLYAMMAQSVSQRTQEIGLRMALGGTGPDILALVFAQGMRPLVIGLGVGVAAVVGVTRILRGVLVGVSSIDPITFLAAVLVLALAGVLGCAIPARRALRVDPVVALRCD